MMRQAIGRFARFSLMSQTRRHLLVAVVAFAVVATACGDDDSAPRVTGAVLTSAADGSTTTNTPPGDDSATTTTEAATSTEATTTTSSTTVAETTAPEAPLSLETITDISQVPEVDVPDGELGLDSLLGGSPDTNAARAIEVDLVAAGLDLTGLQVYVWPVTGTRRSILVLEIDDTATALAEDDTASVVLIETLLDSQVLEEVNIPQLVINYRLTENGEPFVFTISVPIEDLRIGLAEGTDPFANAAIQISGDGA